MPSFFSTHFYHWTFLCRCCAVFYSSYSSAFNPDLSSWEVGKVTNMNHSMYTLVPLFSFFLLCYALILCLNNDLSSFFSTCTCTCVMCHGLFFLLVLVCWCSVFPSWNHWWSLHMGGRECGKHEIKYVTLCPQKPKSCHTFFLLLFCAAFCAFIDH